MVNIDLHVHTAFGSPCAELHKPASIPETMKKKHIHGIVITEHNTMWPAKNIEELNLRLPLNYRVYSGIEVSTSHHHVVVIGLDDPSDIFPGISLEKLLAISKRNNAVAILVHPFSGVRKFFSDPFPDFDGIEVASTMTCGEAQQKTYDLCMINNAIPVAGSDAHCRQNVGKAFTAFPFLPRNEKQLAEQIKKGLGLPMVTALEGKGVRVC